MDVSNRRVNSVIYLFSRTLASRFYLELRKDPHGPDVALFIGNLPANLSHRQYEIILLEFLDEGECLMGTLV